MEAIYKSSIILSKHFTLHYTSENRCKIQLINVTPDLLLSFCLIVLPQGESTPAKAEYTTTFWEHNRRQELHRSP